MQCALAKPEIIPYRQGNPFFVCDW
jgi:hypothetical protein